MYSKHFPHECHLTIWRRNREFLLCLSITYIYFNSTFTRLIVHFNCNSLPEVHQKDKPGSTRSWSASTTYNQGPQILIFLGLTGKINSGFNIIFSIIIFFPTAIDNWGHTLPGIICKWLLTWKQLQLLQILEVQLFFPLNRLQTIYKFLQGWVYWDFFLAVGVVLIFFPVPYSLE